MSVFKYFMLLVFMSTLFFIMHCQQTAATELRPIGTFFREDSVLSAWARDTHVSFKRLFIKSNDLKYNKERLLGSIPLT